MGDVDDDSSVQIVGPDAGGNYEAAIFGKLSAMELYRLAAGCADELRRLEMVPGEPPEEPSIEDQQTSP